MTEIISKEESYSIIGACFNVYNEKGCGFLEPVYQECLGIEFEYQRIPAIAKRSLALRYRGRILKQTYEADYICFEKIIVELKAVSALTDEHRAQLLDYLPRPDLNLVYSQILDTIQAWSTNALRKRTE
jgi:GxxExxY protein